MFPIKVVFLVCLCIILVSTKSTPDDSNIVYFANDFEDRNVPKLDEQLVDQPYDFDSSYETLPNYSIIIIIVAVIKITCVCWVLYRVCYKKKKTGTVVRQPPLPIVAYRGENNLNEKVENYTDQAQSNSEAKPPSYEDSVGTNAPPNVKIL